MSNLDKIMKPKSVAVIGASTKEHTIGSDIMKRLQEYKFNGNIYPVNPKGGVIEGLQAYTSIFGNGEMIKPYFVDKIVDTNNNKIIYEGNENNYE